MNNEQLIANHCFYPFYRRRSRHLSLRSSYFIAAQRQPISLPAKATASKTTFLPVYAS
jgi:hypothetical protein